MVLKQRSERPVQMPAQGSREYWVGEWGRFQRRAFLVAAGLVVTAASMSALSGFAASKIVERANAKNVADFANQNPKISSIMTSAKDKKAQANVTAVVRIANVVARIPHETCFGPDTIARIQFGVSDSTRANEVRVTIENEGGRVEVIKFKGGRVERPAKPEKTSQESTWLPGPCIQ